ncbi:MAG TPA: hypothetical protein VFK89_02465 [Actinomycetota bacterium]|nr:hypothetical protein [Actinomycetota bacterium]
MRFITACAVVVASLGAFAPAGAVSGCPPPSMHDADAHQLRADHARHCRLDRMVSREVSKEGGLGRIAIKHGLAAVLQRDEGIVSLIDVKDPFGGLKVVGRYDDGAQESFDGDLAFSDDGKWLFYARQTHQFSQDGIHVLDVSDPANPSLAFYQPGGGAYRVAFYKNDTAQYVVLLDAVDGLVIYRFEPTTGALAQVFQDAEPALKVGGPASAGIEIDRHDPMTGKPLMYVTTGQTGLQIYDLSTPESASIVGEWPDVGLAEVEVSATKTRRTVWAATEYWFDKTLPPEIEVLDATKLDHVRKVDTYSLGLPADDLWRVEGMDRNRGGLFVAHSHAGVVVFDDDGTVKRSAAAPFEPNEGAGATGSVYSMDVRLRWPYVFVTDAATGRLDVLARPGHPGGFAHPHRRGCSESRAC